MLIINADDWGRSPSETDAALACHAKGLITSVTGMVFMPDSERAANLAKDAGIDTGLHLNFTQEFLAEKCPPELRKDQSRISHFLRSGRYAVLLYNPLLRHPFRRAFRAQLDEFVRLYGRPPSHFDGHQHKHLCANMVLGKVIPVGERVRRNLSLTQGRKTRINRMYRRAVDSLLARSYQLTDFFFSLKGCMKNGNVTQIIQLAQGNDVELMTHPAAVTEYAYLLSNDFHHLKQQVETSTFATKRRAS